MKFEIDFNRLDANNKLEFYEFIGASLEKAPEVPWYTIELKEFEDLEKLLSKINQKYFNVDFGYSAVISFDPPTIYLDKDV